ncbi:MAG: hypothetical protein ABI230_00380 [Aestuariivirga sp.]
MIISSRAVLRASVFLGGSPILKQSDEVIITALRCLIIARVASAVQNGEIIVEATLAADAGDNANITDDATPAVAAIYAARAATYDTIAATHAIANAATLAADAVNFTDAAFWWQVRQDVALLENGLSPQAMRYISLWENNAPPVWWRAQFDAFMDYLAGLDKPKSGNFNDWTAVWNAWFVAIAGGRPAFGLPHEHAEALELRIALGDGRKDFWDREPHVINAEIAGWLRDAWDEAAKQLPPEIPSETELPESFPEVQQFTRGPDGKIRMEADPPKAARSRTEHDLVELYDEAREKAETLGKLSQNQLGAYQDIVRKFIEQLQQNLSDVSINRLWSKAQSLRHILAIHLAEMQKPKDERESSYLLEPDFATKLADAIEQYNVFNVADNRGRQLDLEKYGPEARKMAEDALAIAKPLLPELAEFVTRESLEQTIEENKVADNRSTTLPIDQEKQRVAKLDANLLIQILREAR